MTIQEAFGNVNNACAGCLLNKAERNVVEESLKVIAGELNAYESTKHTANKKVEPVEEPKEETDVKKN